MNASRHFPQLLLQLVVGRGMALPAILAVAVAASSFLASASHATYTCPMVDTREFSDGPDLDSTATLDSGQVLNFDCAGGVTDGTDFNPANAGEIDALGSTKGEHYFEHLVLNATELLFSVEGDRNIYLEHKDGGTDTWGPVNLAQNDLDALELWHDDFANLYSLEGDPDGTAVFDSTGSPVIAQSQLLAGIQSLGVGGGLTSDQVQLDAMLSQTANGYLIFSIEPVGSLDGGEIFVLDLNVLTATYLNHGGHLWNTAFDVSAVFGGASENVNALEALPEPGTALLLSMGLVGLAVGRRRKAL